MYARACVWGVVIREASRKIDQGMDAQTIKVTERGFSCKGRMILQIKGHSFVRPTICLSVHLSVCMWEFYNPFDPTFIYSGLLGQFAHWCKKRLKASGVRQRYNYISCWKVCYSNPLTFADFSLWAPNTMIIFTNSNPLNRLTYRQIPLTKGWPGAFNSCKYMHACIMYFRNAIQIISMNKWI